MKKIVFLFPEAINVDLIKEIGMMPYLMYKFYGYNGSVVTFPNPPYPYLDSELKGLQLDFLDRTFEKEIFKVKRPVLKYLTLQRHRD